MRSKAALTLRERRGGCRCGRGRAGRGPGRLPGAAPRYVEQISRAFPVQPYKESGFPHGKNQWISAARTSWAAWALPGGDAPGDSVQHAALKDLHRRDAEIAENTQRSNEEFSAKSRRSLRLCVEEC